ncbi:MAG: MFS transporter [Burkholderiales bacterium]|nr:MFS transporter [Burkholderiales bacterium]
MNPQAGWPAALAVFAGGLVCGAYVGKVPPALPAQREALGLGLVESGFIATTFNLIGLAGGMFFGLLCDRLGHKRVGLAGLGLMALAGAGGALASDFFALLLTRLSRRRGLHALHGRRLGADGGDDARRPRAAEGDGFVERVHADRRERRAARRAAAP